MIPKPGYKTTELLAGVAASVAGWLLEWAGTLSPKYAAIVMGVSTFGYQLSRGLTKLGALMAQPTVTTQPAPPPPPATPGPTQV